MDDTIYSQQKSRYDRHQLKYLDALKLMPEVLKREALEYKIDFVLEMEKSGNEIFEYEHEVFTLIEFIKQQPAALLPEIISHLLDHPASEELWATYLWVAENHKVYVDDIESAVADWPYWYKTIPAGCETKVYLESWHDNNRLIRLLDLYNDSLLLNNLSKSLLLFPNLEHLIINFDIEPDHIAELQILGSPTLVQTLTVARSNTTTKALQELAKLPCFANVQRLTISAGLTDTTTAVACITSEHLLQLESIELITGKIDFAKLTSALMKTAAVGKKKLLNLIDIPLPVAGFEQFCESPAISHFSGLKIWNTAFTDRHALALTNLRYHSEFRQFSIMAGKELTNTGAILILRSAWVKQLEYLEFESCGFNDNIAHEWQSIERNRLQTLILNYTKIGTKTALVLSQLDFRFLRKLHLNGTGENSDQGFALILCNPSLTQLEEFQAKNNSIGIETANAIELSPHLAALKHIHMGCKVSDEGAEILARVKHLAKLQTLYLDGVSEKGYSALKNSPYLRNCKIGVSPFDLYVRA